MPQTVLQMLEADELNTLSFEEIAAKFDHHDAEMQIRALVKNGLAEPLDHLEPIRNCIIQLVSAVQV